MIVDKDNTLLYIEPQQDKNDEACIDILTQKMAAAFSHRKSSGCLDKEGTYRDGGAFMGTQTCACGTRSDNCDYELEAGYITNSLCVHYLVWHRNEIPESELAKVNSLPDEYVVPDGNLIK